MNATADNTTRILLDELLDLRLQARRLRLAKAMTHQSSSGQQHSRFYGRGMDYAESRAYQAGDDVRRLDWRLTAKTGKLHTKLFQEDHQGSLMILLDTHATMRFGTRGCFKSVQAARAAALAGWMLTKAGEKVGLLTFGDNTSLLKPGSGHRGALALCNRLTKSGEPGTATPLKKALQQLHHLTAKPSRLLLISDGFHLDTDDQKALGLLARRTPLAILGIADALETNLPQPGYYALSIKGKRLPLRLAGKQADHFLQQMQQGQQALEELARQQHAAYQLITGQDNPMTAFQSLFGRLGR